MENKIVKGMMKYCVIGNIAKKHDDENGLKRYGTACFPGGRKVYISRRLWQNEEVTVMGLNRFMNKYALERIPLALIENIRASKTFNIHVLELMRNDLESEDMWWLYKDEDKIGAQKYADLLNQVKSGDKEVLEQYIEDVMYRYM